MVQNTSNRHVIEINCLGHAQKKKKKQIVDESGKTPEKEDTWKFDEVEVC